MPTGTITKRFDNEKNIRVTFDNDREKSYSTIKRELYPILVEGATVDYTIEQNQRGYWNIIAASPAGGAPASAPTKASGAMSYNDRDTLIVDQVLLKSAIDLMGVQINDGNCITPEEAARLAIEAWERIRARHERPELVKAAVELGGVVVVEPPKMMTEDV